MREQGQIAQEPRTAQGRALELLRATLATARWLPTTTKVERLVWAIRGAVVLGIVVLIASAVDKTRWEWLDLLIVPFVLALGGYLFTRSENQRRDRIAEDQRNLDRELADASRQDETLQTYLDGMSELLTDKERPLRRAQPRDNLSTVARARTLTVLARLDLVRKESVMQFLYESGLIYKDRLVLDLSGADLIEADLGQANLSGANVTQVYLGEAYLIEADLSGANLSRADLRGANLGGALGVTNEEVEQQAAYLAGATMPNGQKYEEWVKSKGRGEDGENSTH